MDSSLPWANGTAQSSQNACHVIADMAVCAYIPKSASGSDAVTFRLRFSQGKTYRLVAAVELYANATPITSASTFRDFTIAVSATGSQGPTTQILSANVYPSNVTSGDTVFIVATVSYSGGYWLWANLIDLSTKQPAPATVTSTPSCTRSNGSVCGILTDWGSGTATFTWIFLIEAPYSEKVLYDVQTFMADSSPKPVTYNTASISHYHLPIRVEVQPFTFSQTQTAPQASPTYSSGTTSLPQSSSPAGNDSALGALAVVAAVLVGLVLFSRSRRKPYEPPSRAEKHHGH